MATPSGVFAPDVHGRTFTLPVLSEDAEGVKVPTTTTS